MDPNIVYIGIGEYRIGKSPDVLRTVLGSCVGVLIYDRFTKIGGLAHIYLPYSKNFNNVKIKPVIRRKYDFADLLIPKMINEMVSQKALRPQFEAYLIGGGFLRQSTHFEDIGLQNLKASRKVLRDEKISIRELDVGGNCGRTVWFYLFDGEINIKIHEYDLFDL